MITGINYLRIFSVMITDRETNFTDLQANDFGNLGKDNSRNILVGNHAVIFTEINFPIIFFRSVMFVWRMVYAIFLSTTIIPNDYRRTRRGSYSTKDVFLPSKHLLSAFYKTLPSKNPSKNLVFTENPYRHLLRTLLRTLLRSTYC